MKKGIIVHKGDNIGDFVQSIAAAQFLGNWKELYLIEREKLNEYKDDEELFLIMNAWFMRESMNWPPSDKISPFFLAFHINSIAKDNLLSEKSITYLKKHEPIGCRDINTMNMLQEKGVNSFFSGCLTLTLGEKYYSNNRNDKIYISNLSYPSNSLYNLRNYTILAKTLILHPKLLKRIYKNNKTNKTTIFRKFIDAANIINTYYDIIDSKILAEAEYINHIINFDSYENMLTTAENLIKKYAQAKAVITNKIHCALPCLGLETPVIWIEDINGDDEYKCRLNGISNLFNKISYKKGKAYINIDSFKGNKITINNFPKNPDNYKPIKEKLLQFIRERIIND